MAVVSSWLQLYGSFQVTNATPNKGPERGAGDHFKSSWPQWTGLQVCYISGPNQVPPSQSDSGNGPLWTDCALELEHMKWESLVIAEQLAAVNRSLSCAHTAHHVRKDIFG